MFADMDEEESENENRSESQIQPQIDHNKSNPPQNEHLRSTRVFKKPQTIYDSSKYKSKRKTNKSKTSTSPIKSLVDSQTLPLYKRVGASSHSGNHFNFGTEIALISHSINVSILYRQARSPELFFRLEV